MEISAALKRKDAQRAGGGSGPSTKRRRVRGGGVIGTSSGHAKNERATFAAATGANPEAFEEDAEKLAEMLVLLSFFRTNNLILTFRVYSIDRSGPSAADLETPNIEEEGFNPVAFEEYFGLISQEDLVVIRPYLGDEDDRILEELRPKYVVMFDPDPAFVRRIEVRSLLFSFSLCHTIKLNKGLSSRFAGLQSCSPRSRRTSLLLSVQGFGRRTEIPQQYS